jgi:hypothetical protein
MAIVTVNHNQIRFTKADQAKTVVLLKKGVTTLDDSDLEHPYIKILMNEGIITQGGVESTKVEPEVIHSGDSANSGVKLTVGAPVAEEGAATADDAPVGKGSKAKKAASATEEKTA